MKTLWTRIKPWAPALLAAVAVAVLLLAAPGCQSTVPSLLDPDREVTRPELAGEVRRQAAAFEAEKERLAAEFGLKSNELNARIANFNETAEDKVAALDRQDAWRLSLLNAFNSVATSAAEGTLNPAALAILGLSTVSGLVYGALGIKRPNDVDSDQARAREHEAWDKATRTALETKPPNRKK